MNVIDNWIGIINNLDAYTCKILAMVSKTLMRFVYRLRRLDLLPTNKFKSLENSERFKTIIFTNMYNHNSISTRVCREWFMLFDGDAYDYSHLRLVNTFPDCLILTLASKGELEYPIVVINDNLNTYEYIHVFTKYTREDFDDYPNITGTSLPDAFRKRRFLKLHNKYKSYSSLINASIVSTRCFGYYYCYYTLYNKKLYYYNGGHEPYTRLYIIDCVINIDNLLEYTIEEWG